MDPISDMISIIKNGYKANRNRVRISYSKLKEDVARSLKEAGFLESITVVENKKKIELVLAYKDNKSVITDIKRMSKPSLRVYSSIDKIPKVLAGKGLVILSTPKGILNSREAKKAKVGGELLLKVW